MNTPMRVSPAWWIEALAAARTWAAAQVAAAEGAAAAACAAREAERAVLWAQVQAALPLAVREALAAALTAAPDPPEVRLEIDGQPYTLRWVPAAAAGTPGHWCLAGDQPAWKPTAVIAPEHLLAELLGRWDAAYGGDPPVTSALAPTLAAARAYQTRKVRQERARARRARADFSTRLAAAVAPYPDLLPRLALRVRLSRARQQRFMGGSDTVRSRALCGGSRWRTPRPAGPMIAGS